MPKFKIPFRRQQSSRRTKSSGQIPRWIAVAGVLGTLALGYLGYFDKKREERDQEQLAKAEAEFKRGEILSQLNKSGRPIVVISQDGHPVNSADLANGLGKLDELIAKRPNDSALYAAKGLLSLKMGNERGAETLARRALSIDPQAPNALITKALVDAMGGDIRAAKEGFERARDSAHSRSQLIEEDVARVNLVNVLVEMGQLSEARKELEGPLRNPLTQPIADNALGNLLLIDNRLDEAAEAFLRASADKEFLGAAQNLACTYKRQNKEEEFLQQVALIVGNGGVAPECAVDQDAKVDGPYAGVKGAGSYWQIIRDF